MFTVPSRDIGGMIGTSLGQGFQKGYSNALEYNIGRERIQKALGSIEDLARDPNAIQNPLSLLVSLQKGLAGVPGSQQMIGDIFPTLLRSLGIENMKKYQPPIPGMGGTAEAPAELPASQASQENIHQLRERIGSARPSQPLIQPSSLPASWGGGPIPSIFTPDQITQTERGMRAAYIPDDVINSTISNMQRHNENARSQVQDILGGFETQKALSEEQGRAEDRWLNFVKQNVPGLDNPLDQARFLRMSERYANEPNIHDRARKTQIDFNAGNRALENFRESSKIGHPSITPSAIQQRDLESNRRAFETLRDLGMADEAESILADNGYGPVQIAQVTNPLSPEQEKEISSLAPSGLMKEKSFLLSNMDEDNIGSFSNDLSRVSGEEDKAVKHLSQYISKYVNPYHLDKNSIKRPGTNMYLLRHEMTNRGMTDASFLQSVNDAIDSGWTPDPDQLTQINRIREGQKRSLWEVLRGTF